MANDLVLSVERRAQIGKGKLRQVRNAGYIPGVYYDGKGLNIPVMVKEVPLEKAYSQVGGSRFFTLKIDGDESVERPAFIWRLDHHPFKNKVVHVDFYGVDLDKPIRVHVDVVLTGKAKGVAIDGGLLQLFRDKIEVECLPRDIPENITLDVSDLGMNDTVHISSVALPQGVKAVHHDDDFAVVGVVPQEAGDEEEGAAEAAS